jgi:hypothetical protein
MTDQAGLAGYQEKMMSESNPIRIYAVHGWEKDEDYVRLFEYMESAGNFFYRAVSDPDAHSPLGDGVAARRTLVFEALKNAECVVCTAGVWEQHRDWARMTLDVAAGLDLPVIAIEHFGPKNMDVRLKAQATACVGWDSRSIVDAIRREARHEETMRFDTIEFDM